MTTDVYGPEKRSAVMRRVKGKDTAPERQVRRLIWSLGGRYRLNRADLPGKPDIVLAGRRLAIFVHGCFWHGHDCARGARVPKAHRDYWQGKIGPQPGARCPPAARRSRPRAGGSRLIWGSANSRTVRRWKRGRGGGSPSAADNLAPELIAGMRRGPWSQPPAYEQALAAMTSRFWTPICGGSTTPAHCARTSRP